MRISAKAEYACIAMLELAANFAEPQPVRLKAIADTHGVPQRFLVQILLQLKGIGLVATVRGAAGGYQLARSPETISLAEVINAIDGSPPARTAPEAKRHSAMVHALHNLWKEVDAEEQRMLAELTLADVVRRAQQSGELSYQI
jgi:Rrf2 family cysteine metabolism transcriptional repressor